MIKTIYVVSPTDSDAPEFIKGLRGFQRLEVGNSTQARVRNATDTVLSNARNFSLFIPFGGTKIPFGVRVRHDSRSFLNVDQFDTHIGYNDYSKVQERFIPQLGYYGQLSDFPLVSFSSLFMQPFLDRNPGRSREAVKVLMDEHQSDLTDALISRLELKLQGGYLEGRRGSRVLDIEVVDKVSRGNLDALLESVRKIQAGEATLGDLVQSFEIRPPAVETPHRGPRKERF